MRRSAWGARVELIKDMHAVPAQLVGDLSPGDVVLVLGAGDINRIARPLLDALGAA